MTQLFDRQRETTVTIAPEGEEGRQWEGPELMITWMVKHKRNQNPSTADIQLYNLNRDSKDYIREGKKAVRLKTGLRGPVQIFIGYIKDGGISKNRNQGDEILEFEASDKAFEGQKKHVDMKIPSKTDIKEAVEHIAYGADIPIETLDFGTNPPKLQASMVISETAKDAFNKLAQRTGVDIWTKNGKLVAAQRGKSPRSKKVTRFSTEDGTLFNVDPMKKNRIRVTGLLKPQLRPGDLFALDHDRYDGGWRCRDVTFRGNSGWEETYEVEITAEPR